MDTQKFDSYKIISNKARCKKCGDIIESVSRHDFVICSCGLGDGGIAVDGGKSYLRRCGDLNNYEELSETVELKT